MANVNNRRALRLVKLLGAPVVVFGGFLIYMGITMGIEAARTSQASIWWGAALEFIFPLVWLALGGLLVGLAYQLECRPTARALSWAAWVALFWLSGALYSVLVWLGLSPKAHPTGTFGGTLAVAAILCMIGYWKLGKASGLIDAERRWWCQKAIRNLCSGIVFLMFLMMSTVIGPADSWRVGDDQHTHQLLVFFGWLALMAIVYQLGPPLLIRLTHVGPDASAATPPQEQKKPSTIDDGTGPK